MIGGQYEDNQDNRNIPEYVRALPVQILYVYSGKSQGGGGRYEFELRTQNVRGNASEGLDINMIDNNSSRTRRRDAGVALPAGICNFINPVTFCAMIFYPP